MKKKFTHDGRGRAFARPQAALAILAGAGLLNAGAALAREPAKAGAILRRPGRLAWTGSRRERCRCASPARPGLGRSRRRSRPGWRTAARVRG
ncbi:hypothetical protein [Pseudoduganella namucuonensis]|uniref:hypothetical protein n=1 Tax=Pseudoduganella namucuonensis TaxID=1035707 RepID=UPI00116069D6|nr:hypothetical protein [Pseudoduganella namucuonensis]